MEISWTDSVLVIVCFFLQVLCAVSDGIMGVMTVEYMNYFPDTPEAIISAVVVSQYTATMIGSKKCQAYNNIYTYTFDNIACPVVGMYQLGVKIKLDYVLILRGATA